MSIKINDKVIVLSAIDAIKDNLLAAQTQTRGAIAIDVSIASGDFVTEMLFDAIGDVTRRDPNTNATITPEELSNIQGTNPKLYFKKYMIMRYTDLARYGTDLESMQVKLGTELGIMVVRYILDMGLTALRGAIESEANATYSSANTELTLKDVNAGVYKFGDKAQEIVTLVAPSLVVKNFIDSAIDSTADQISYGAVYNAQVGTLGRQMWVIDSDVLTGDGKETILGLAKGALVISESEVVRLFSQEILDKENTGVGIKTEGAYTVDVKGYGYDVAKGANPTKATLADTTAWSLYGQLKNSAGVIVKGA